MNTGPSTATLVQDMTDAGVTIGADVLAGGITRTAAAMRAVDFHVASPCRRVAVAMTMDGAVSDIVIREGALDDVGPERMAHLLTTTIQEAQDTAREAMRAFVAQRLDNGRHGKGNR